MTARTDGGGRQLFVAPPWARGDTLLALGLALAGLLSRVPFVAHRFYSADSVRFGLALDHFDVGIDQPHSPGYFFYVLLARGLRFLTRDPNAALIGVGLLLTAASAVAIFALGREMLGRSGGLLATAFLLTSPAYWLYGGVGLSYVSEPFWGTIGVLAARRARARSAAAFAVLSLALGLAGGFRAHMVFLLAPLWVFAALRFSWRVWALGMALLTLACVTWLVPTVVLSGGVEGLLVRTGSQAAEDSIFAVSLRNLGRNNLKLLFSLGWAAGPLLPFVVWAMRDWARRASPLARSDGSLLLVWMVPPLMFFSLIYFIKAALIFTVLPGIVLWAAATFVRPSFDTLGVRRRARLIVAVLAAQIIVFLSHPVYGRWPLLREMFESLEATPVRSSDARVTAFVGLIGQYDPARIVVITVQRETYRQWNGFMHVLYYLPEYTVANLWFHSDPPHVNLIGRGKAFTRTRAAWESLRDDRRTLVFVAPSEEPELQTMFGAARRSTEDRRFQAYVRGDDP